MKKLILLFVFSLVLLNGVYSPIQAGTESITWTCTTLGGVAVIEGNVDINNGTKSLTVGLPSGSYLEANILETWTSYYFFIGMKDGASFDTVLYNDIADEGVTENLINSNLDLTNFIVNFDAYDVGSNVDNMYIRMPISAPCATSTADNVIDELNDDGTYTYTYDELSLGSLAFAYYPNYRLAPSSSLYEDLIMSNYIEVPYGVTDITARIQWDWTLFGPESVSTVHYYDEDKVELFFDLIQNDTGDDVFHDWYPFDIGLDLMDVAWSFWNYDVSLAVKYIRFEMYDFNDSFTLVNQQKEADENMYFFDGESLTINYIVDGEISESYYGLVGSIVPYQTFPYPTISGETFSHWIDANGEVFDNTAITEAMVSNNIVNIYAIYTVDPITINPDIDDPTPDGGVFEETLDDVGFNDPVERVIVFAVIIIAVSILLLYMEVSLFSILIVDGVIVAFFISLGLIPTFVSAIIIIVILFLAYRFIMNGGGGNE